MIDTDKLLRKTLGKIGVPVSRAPYKGKSQEFITYQLTMAQPCDYADDEEGAKRIMYAVDIFTINNFFLLCEKTTDELKKAGFEVKTINGEIYENETGLYHIPIDIEFMEV